MISRRTLIKWGAAAAASLPVAAQANVFGRLPEGVDAVLLDRRYARQSLAEAFVPRVYTFEGDVTQVWFETLDPIWRKRGFVLAGITGQDTLFVLERLAWDRGRRVVSRRELPVLGGDGRAVQSWVIAPVHPSVKG